MKLMFWRKKRRSRPSLMWLLTLVPASAIGTLFYRSRKKMAQERSMDGQDNRSKARKQDANEKTGPVRMKNTQVKDQKENERETQGMQKLEVVEGIGPKIAEILRAEGITTLRQLANTSVDRLNQILDEAGLRISQPDSWPEQAGLAADERWEEFDKLKARLRAGRKVK